MTPADSPDSRNQSEPVHEKNKNENCGIKPKSLPHQLATDDVLQKVVQSRDQPFPKILYAAGNRLCVSCRNLGKNDDGGRDDPCHKHRVCDSETADLN